MSIRSLLVILAVAVGLTVLFWGPLWQGYGLIGGDLYTYFFPQKLFYAGELAEGRLPLWNNLVGFGYPVLAESQTGVFYPPNPILYRLFDVNTAYNVSQLGHYVLAFVFTWLLLRRLDLSAAAATLAAAVFVYGWFPPRICLEWAILGGVYFPLALWCVESFLQSSRPRWLFLLAMSQGIYLLAGHFNLAFITQLTCVAYAGLRVWAFGVRGVDKTFPNAERRHPNATVTIAVIIAAIAVGFALATVQILPTWELKQLSQREGIGGPHDPGYGHIPPWYLSQIVVPWLWYPLDVDPDQALRSIHALTISSATNKVEAHLYFGMVPLLLIGYRLVAAMRGAALDRRHRHWLWLGLAAMIYTIGWLLPVTRHLPGFSFFMGPGRYGIVTTLAAALLAGAGLDRLLDQHKIRARSVVIGLVVGLTIADLYWVSRRVTYAVMVADPPIRQVEESEVRGLLQQYEAAHGSTQPVRMLAPGANLATLTGFAAYPPYLGLGPVAYYDPALAMPEPTADMSEAERAAAIVARQKWLSETAITHVLSMEPLDARQWPGTVLVWQGFDRLLNPAWGRREPLFLYERPGTLPRARPRVAAAEPDDAVRITSFAASTLEMEAATQREAMSVIIADLAYPGWKTTLDGEVAKTDIDVDHHFPIVDVPPGNHVLVRRYEPGLVALAAGISLLTATAVVVFSAALWWKGRDGNAGGGSTT